MSNKSESIQFGPPKMSRCSNGRLYAVRINCLNVLAVRTNLPGCARPPLPASTDLFGFTEATSNDGRSVAGVCANADEAIASLAMMRSPRAPFCMPEYTSLVLRGLFYVIDHEHIDRTLLRLQLQTELFLQRRKDRRTRRIRRRRHSHRQSRHVARSGRRRRRRRRRQGPGAGLT